MENRRWLLRTTHGGRSAFVDPTGRSTDRFSPDFSWPAVEEVELHDGLSLFTRGGWLFGPISMALALLVLIASAASRWWLDVDMRREDDPRLTSPRDPPHASPRT